MSPTNRFRHLEFGVIGLCLFVVFGSMRNGSAEIELGHRLKKNQAPGQAKRLPFGPSDFIRVAQSPMRKNNFMLGEPVVVPIRLVNHTQFTITILTNLTPRANLEVNIQSSTERERRYWGPHPPGNYVDQEFLLYPLEEFPMDILIWGDSETPNGLAFPQAGAYKIKISLVVGAKGTDVRGPIPLDPFVINVQTPPAQFAPLINMLCEAKAFPDLQLRHMPDALKDRMVQLANDYPNAPVSPYLTYVLALRYYGDAMQDSAEVEKYKIAEEYLVRTALADSTLKAEAYEDLIRLYDRWEKPDLALKACQELIKAAPPQIAPRFGSVPYIQKYLINSAEMSPVKYWDIMN